jgi:hypothetical protein
MRDCVEYSSCGVFSEWRAVVCCGEWRASRDSLERGRWRAEVGERREAACCLFAEQRAAKFNITLNAVLRRTVDNRGRAHTSMRSSRVKTTISESLFIFRIKKGEIRGGNNVTALNL